ncbi:MAG TPA: hypothetical protein VGP72_31605 [Planctomycetota bacterium]|jgi:hypothetical protein
MEPVNATPPQVFTPECLAAVKTFRRAKPWRGNVEERKEKFTALHTKLCAAYHLTVALSFADDIDPLAAEAASRFENDGKTITLHRKLSVVTYLVAIGMARGFDYAQAWLWAVELYRQMFPISYARHSVQNGFIVRRQGQ